jgi:hypothetical protein
MAQVVMRMLMEGNQILNRLRKRGLLIWSPCLIWFRGKILISLWFKKKKDLALL